MTRADPRRGGSFRDPIHRSGGVGPAVKEGASPLSTGPGSRAFAASLLRGAGLGAVPEEMLSESEKRHEQYRRRQAMGGRTSPAAERLPIMTTEERKARDKDRPKYHATEFEGPIEKLIEKYRDLDEVRRHLTLGQAMKYEFTEDGRILDRDGVVLYDGTVIPPPRK